MSNARKLSLFLAEYNLWRRGPLNKMSSCCNPTEVGAVIDEAVDLLERYDELEGKNASLQAEVDQWAARCASAIWMLPETVTGSQLIDAQNKWFLKMDTLKRENAALRRSEESLRTTLWGTEFELEKANAELNWLNTNCVSADPIMGRSTYRWTIEHDEPDIRAAIDAARAKEAKL